MVDLLISKTTSTSEVSFTNRNCSGQYGNNGMFFLLQGQMFSVILSFSLDHDTIIIVDSSFGCADIFSKLFSTYPNYKLNNIIFHVNNLVTFSINRVLCTKMLLLVCTTSLWYTFYWYFICMFGLLLYGRDMTAYLMQ